MNIIETLTGNIEGDMKKKEQRTREIARKNRRQKMKKTEYGKDNNEKDMEKRRPKKNTRTKL